jgi:uncharacterized protein with NRDE domain
MCLIVFQYDAHPAYDLVLAANRDEFYERPTEPAHFWDDAPHVLAGRDGKEGGTWCGVTRDGRWAAVTNYRDPDTHMADAPSRGHLVSDFLTGTSAPRRYVETVAARADQYNGFNLLVGSPDACLYVSNRDGGVQWVPPGTHGLSNHLLDTPWPKVERGTRKLAQASNGTVDVPALLDLLDDRTEAHANALPDTGVDAATEKMLSPIFIQSADYGTRSSTVLLLGRDGQATFAERTYDHGAPADTRTFSFELSPRSRVTEE